MAVNLVFHAIDNGLVAFNIDLDLYFIKLEPVPKIYDENLKPQLIPNFDSWFQAKTHQRYSFRQFCDMIAAFQTGLEKSYSLGDLKEIVVESMKATKFALFEHMGEYGKRFWVEILDPNNLESGVIVKIRDNFDKLRQSMGDDKFYNLLCRLRKLAETNRPGLAVVFERLIRRMGKEPNNPKYPNSDDLDVEIAKTVLRVVLDKNKPMHKGISPHIQERLDVMNGRRT